MNIKGIITSSFAEVFGLFTLYELYYPEIFFLYLAIHLGVSVFIALSLRPFMPRRFRSGLIYAFGSLIFLSGPGGFVISITVYALLLFKGGEVLPLYENVSTEIIPEIEFGGRKAGESFGHVQNPNMVMYMSKVRHPLAVRYLREAISSNDDEVRLVAFASLSAMEKDLMDKIAVLKDSLKEDLESRDLFSTHLSLAELYWELVYLNISDRELEAFYLGEVEKHALKALEIKEDPKVHFLLGRLYLRRKEVDKAEQHLLRSMELGFPGERLATYLLEVYFVRKDFTRLFELTERFKDVIPTDNTSASILRVWT